MWAVYWHTVDLRYSKYNATVHGGTPDIRGVGGKKVITSLRCHRVQNLAHGDTLEEEVTMLCHPSLSL